MSMFVKITLLLIAVLYAVNVYTALNTARTNVISLNAQSMEVNSQSSPGDGIAIRNYFVELGCVGEVCTCSVKRISTTTSRVQRLLVVYENDFWSIFYMAVPWGEMLIRTLHIMDITDEQIAQMRSEGKQKFAETLVACQRGQ